jgi:ABC-type Fe3+/spermidine/putrescine transport system ATPase subunit
MIEGFEYPSECKHPATSYVAEFIGDANVLPASKNVNDTVHVLGHDFQ